MYTKLLHNHAYLSVRVFSIVVNCCALRSIFGEQPLMSTQRANFLFACIYSNMENDQRDMKMIKEIYSNMKMIEVENYTDGQKSN